MIPAKREEKKQKRKWQLIPSSCYKPTDLKGHGQKKWGNRHVKLSFIEGQSSLLAVWAIFPLSHLALISTSDFTKRAPCKRDKLSDGRS